MSATWGRCRRGTAAGRGLWRGPGTRAAPSGEADDGLSRRMRVQEAVADRQRRLAQLRGEMRGLVSSQRNMRGQSEELAGGAGRAAPEGGAGAGGGEGAGG